jgi:hypothetical protein
MYPYFQRTGHRTLEGIMVASERGPASIAEAFLRNAEAAPQKLCLRFEGEEISYRSVR